ncbi:organic solute transporter subunit alpha isoform X2 [Cylas formicarius]|nr:organic solute transporter subunit alpha isoform X2 [Cylas formicarius]
MDRYGILILLISAALLAASVFLFLDITYYVIRRSASRVKAYTTFVLAVYPVTSLVSFFAILLPRANLLAEAITQGAFMAGMYKLFCLFMAYSGGCHQLAQMEGPKRLMLNVGPCCCWPCCHLPTFKMDKRTFMFLRLLVFQLPVVQSLIYLVYLIMWAEQESLYLVNYMYLQPIVILSILVGVWGMAMAINILKNTLNEEFKLFGKFIVLQLVLVFSKLQGFITRCLVWQDVLPCDPPIIPQVYANLIHNTLMMAEMVILAFLARKLYKRELPCVNEVRKGNVNIIKKTITTNQSCDIIEKDVKESSAYDNVAYE